MRLHGDQLANGYTDFTSTTGRVSLEGIATAKQQGRALSLLTFICTHWSVTCVGVSRSFCCFWGDVQLWQSVSNSWNAWFRKSFCFFCMNRAMLMITLVNFFLFFLILLSRNGNSLCNWHSIVSTRLSFFPLAFFWRSRYFYGSSRFQEKGLFGRVPPKGAASLF